MIEFAAILATSLQIAESKVFKVLSLLEEGATVPFIARYRKDVTGNLDEVQILAIQQGAALQKELAERRASILKSIEEQGKLTEALEKAIIAATTMVQLEDLYLPYKTKRKTKAHTAREQGLEPLALWLLEQNPDNCIDKANTFFNEVITTSDLALQGARDIIAEMINENAEVRQRLRQLFEKEAVLKSEVFEDKKIEAEKYKDYFAYSGPASATPSHRFLAMFRASMEGFLKIDAVPDPELSLHILEQRYVLNTSEAGKQVQKACKESYTRLLKPSLELELKMAMKTKADEEAIQVFADNLKQLLLSSPLGSKRMLAIDPGYRSGCKIVCLSESGDLLKSSLIYIHEPNKLMASEHQIRSLVQEFNTEVIAIGDGTAGRETERFIKQLQLGLPVVLVNEDGASIYSASEVAREEFPDQDLTIRGAVSIGRRLMDPLAELVKIDPKSIGVGQYQHDVNPFKLKSKLDQTVSSCVNTVGVNLNTASKQLLSYVSGIGENLAGNIIAHRKTIGAFKSREELKKVARLGDKAFEQSAGFLRIRNGQHPLDNSAVHPEHYSLVERWASDLKITLPELIGQEQNISKIAIANYEKEFGQHTVADILKELKKPGLDPRGTIEHFEFAEIYSLEDVKVGAILPGVVTNLTKFGAFVDIGVKQDGLVHVSEIAHRYIKDPSEALKLNQQVQVKVMEVDISRKRILLSIKQTQEVPNTKERKQSGALLHKAPETTMEQALASLKDKFKK